MFALATGILGTVYAAGSKVFKKQKKVKKSVEPSHEELIAKIEALTTNSLEWDLCTLCSTYMYLNSNRL